MSFNLGEKNMSFNLGEKNMSNLVRLKKVSDSFTINRYDNGWMVEISGKNSDDDWSTVKFVCNTEDDLIKLIAAYNKLELDR